jgi:hypothetical protein|tara:strand:+ start:61 stop:639 length:579 start_codon:yes stop_codon:yes gene_type:complete
MRSNDTEKARLKLNETLAKLEISKEQHAALVRKYVREINVSTNEARRAHALAHGEPSTDFDTRGHVLSILRRRAVLRRSVATLRGRMTSLFAHELTLEQGLLLVEHMSTMKSVRDALQVATDANAADNALDIMEKVGEMTDRICEVSDLLAEPTITMEIDESVLEDELVQLCLPVVPTTAPTVDLGLVECEV